MLAWIVLFDIHLYMGMAMLKAAQKHVGIFFGIAHKLAQCISWRKREISRHGRGYKSSSPLFKSLYWQHWGVLCKPPLPWPYSTGIPAL